MVGFVATFFLVNSCYARNYLVNCLEILRVTCFNV